MVKALGIRTAFVEIIHLIVIRLALLSSMEIVNLFEIVQFIET